MSLVKQLETQHVIFYSNSLVIVDVTDFYHEHYAQHYFKIAPSLTIPTISHPARKIHVQETTSEKETAHSSSHWNCEGVFRIQILDDNDNEEEEPMVIWDEVIEDEYVEQLVTKKQCTRK